MKALGWNINWYYSIAPLRGEPTGYTECLMYKGTTDELGVLTGHWGKGIAQCIKGDNFKKDTGRKLSLARALKHANLNKEERTQVWEAYRDMSPKKRW